MKKILMYTTSQIFTGKRITGGIKRFNMLYYGLINNGYSVDLYCGDEQEKLKELNIDAKSVKINTSNSKLLFPNLKIMLNNLKLLLKLKKENYSAVIVFDVPTAISLALLKFKNLNLFLRQDLIEYRKIIIKNKNAVYKFIYMSFMKLCEYICCKNASKIIVQCNYDLNNLANRHKTIKKNILAKSFVQINNINAPWIVEKSKIELKDKKEKDNVFKIGFIGDFSNERKGHQLLLPALKSLLDDKYDIEGYIIGDGKELEKYQREYKYKKIKFLGRMSNPIEIVKKMDLMIVPSLADSCPNTVLESMYNDILVIGTNRGGIPEIIKNEELLFEPEIEYLKQKIIMLIKDNNYHKQLVDLQKNRKKELLFNWEEKIINVLEQ